MRIKFTTIAKVFKQRSYSFGRNVKGWICVKCNFIFIAIWACFLSFYLMVKYILRHRLDA
jgi:hypothetical protein